jgi:glutamate 5-kinase
VGTWFPERRHLDARRRWIAFAAAPRGVLHLDPGAVAALRERHASLLAAGVVTVEGRFRAGDVVELRDPGGGRVGRGVVAWDAAAVRRWCAGHPPEGTRNAHALIRRNEIVLEV